MVCQVVNERPVTIWLTCLSKGRIMIDIKCRLEVRVSNTFHGSGLYIKRAPGEIPYPSGTKLPWVFIVFCHGIVAIA